MMILILRISFRLETGKDPVWKLLGLIFVKEDGVPPTIDYDEVHWACIFSYDVYVVINNLNY